MSRIEQIIDEIEDYLDGCKYAALSNKNILVNKEEMEELISELRSKTPEEIKRYQKIINNKEAIMADAQQRAEEIIAQAREQAAILVSEHPITQQAILEAEAIRAEADSQAQDALDAAINEANSIRISAMTYTDELLKNVESILLNSVDTTRARYENLLSCLQSYLDVVVSNRAELNPENATIERKEVKEAPAPEKEAPAPVVEEEEEAPAPAPAAAPVEEDEDDSPLDEEATDEELEEIDL